MELGPSSARLTIETYREGVAAKVGHDLILEVGSWSGSFADGSASLDADPTSLTVVDGRNGLKPLTEKDRREIVGNIEKKVLGRAPISFRSTAVDGNRVTGDLTLAGSTRPVTFELDPSGPSARATVVQSQWGIKPYTAFMGAHTVRDAVEIVLAPR